jgi:hypothetical protein
MNEYDFVGLSLTSCAAAISVCFVRALFVFKRNQFIRGSNTERITNGQDALMTEKARKAALHLAAKALESDRPLPSLSVNVDGSAQLHWPEIAASSDVAADGSIVSTDGLEAIRVLPD